MQTESKGDAWALPPTGAELSRLATAGDEAAFAAAASKYVRALLISGVGTEPDDYLRGQVEDAERQRAAGAAHCALDPAVVVDSDGNFVNEGTVSVDEDPVLTAEWERIYRQECWKRGVSPDL